MSSSPVSDHTRQSFRAVLETVHKCEYLGKPIARPYADPDDMPDQFRSPLGRVFNVPQPSAIGGRYYQWILDDVLKDNQLEVANTQFKNPPLKDAVNE